MSPRTGSIGARRRISSGPCAEQSSAKLPLLNRSKDEHPNPDSLKLVGKIQLEANALINRSDEVARYTQLFTRVGVECQQPYSEGPPIHSPNHTGAHVQVPARQITWSESDFSVGIYWYRSADARWTDLAWCSSTAYACVVRRLRNPAGLGAYRVNHPLRAMRIVFSKSWERRASLNPVRYLDINASSQGYSQGRMTEPIRSPSRVTIPTFNQLSPH